MQAVRDTWGEIALLHLTPRSIGMLECVSKTMWCAMREHGVWEKQAVLAWNGFYGWWDGDDYRSASEVFLVYRWNERPEDEDQDDCDVKVWDEWRDWDGILEAMYIPEYGEGDFDAKFGWDDEDHHEYESGYVTDCAFEVTKKELARDWRYATEFELNHHFWCCDNMKIDRRASLRHWVAMHTHRFYEKQFYSH
jgi:hypothetical protein